MSPRLTLASQSTARRAILQGAGVPFEAAVSGVDEEALKSRLLEDGRSACEIAEALAEAKAVRVSQVRPGLVLGADQTLEFEGGLYDKVETLEAARERLRLLRGKPHRLHAALSVARDGAVVWRDTVSATLTLRAFSEDFLRAYLAAEGDAALGSVGCYRLEGQGVQLFEAIEGDYFAILGLPLTNLLEFLRQQGVLTA